MIYVGLVGELIAEVIGIFRTEYNMVINILFGHSLGAHVIGKAGRLTDPPLSKCIGNPFSSGVLNSIRLINFFFFAGADLAGPLYTYPILVDPSQRLVSTDCLKVITLCCEKYLLGSEEIKGNVAIIVNNGTNQPPCVNNPVCDHMSCPYFVIEPMRKNKTCDYDLLNVATDEYSVSDLDSIPFGNYTMTTKRCFPYCTIE